MPKGARSRGGSAAENAVLDEVWKEVGGELVQEFMVPTVSHQPRRIDGIFVVDDTRRPLPGDPSALRGRDVVICQAKAGRLDLGVLGQTLFSAELIREYAPRNVCLIAAAVESDPLVERLLDSYRPLTWRIEHRAYPDLPLGESSGETVPSAMRQEMVEAVHDEVGGFAIKVGNRRNTAGDFAKVQVTATGQPLCRAEPDAIILPDRQPGEVGATAATDVRTGEPVVLVYTSWKFYMTTMGRAVFGGQVARGELGLANVKSYFCYRNDNAVLRKLIEQLPDIVVLPG